MSRSKIILTKWCLMLFALVLVLDAVSCASVNSISHERTESDDFSVSISMSSTDVNMWGRVRVRTEFRNLSGQRLKPMHQTQCSLHSIYIPTLL
jgi:hypothetical protein